MSLEILPLTAYQPVAPRDHSWVSVDETVPFFAQASYIVNPDDISISLSAANINIDLDQTNAGIQTINANLSTANTNLGNLLNYNNFVIPPFDEIALTNTTAGNPASAVYLKDSVTVATLVFTYDGDDFMTNAKIVYPA